jgi:8-oxo-dGTP diphosphatase
MPLQTIPVSAAILIDPDRRILIAQRPPGKPMAGLWEFPGGKIEPNELPEAALVRELEEELGIETAENCLAPFGFVSHRYYRSPPPSAPEVPGLCPAGLSQSWHPELASEFHLLMLCYACRKWNGIATPREGQAVRWVRARDLTAIPMPPADLPLIPMLLDQLA